MIDYDFKRTSRKCSISARVLQRGEEFYSALVEKYDQLVRLDYAVESWTGPPENCIGWWKSRLPMLEKEKVYWAPDDVLLAYFDHMRMRQEHADVAFVMALLLVRKKILHLIETQHGDRPSLILRKRNENTVFHVEVADLTPERTAEIQAELADNLFVDEPPPLG